MAFGFPAYHTELYAAATDKAADLRFAVQATLSALSWSIREEAAEQIVASTGVNMRSWGEKVLINFLPDSSISITSKCALPTQCSGLGKEQGQRSKVHE